MSHIYQEPHEPTFRHNQPGQGPHPERVQTDFGGSTPAHPDWRPNPLDARPKNKNKLIATTAAVGVGVVAVAGAAFFGAKSAVNEVGNKLTGTDAANSAPEIPGQGSTSGSHEVDYSKIDAQTLTVDQFYDDSIYPQEYRVKWANEIIKQREQQAHAELSSILVQHGHPALGPLVTPDINNTVDEIMVQHDVVNYIASTSPNPTEGRKLLVASADYELSRHTFATIGKEPMVTFHRVVRDGDTNQPLESPVFKDVAAGNYTPNGTLSKIAIIQDGITNESSEVIERFIGGRYVTHDTMKPGDSGIVKHPEQIKDQ